ncbi:MAG: AlkA N-terminal domain-containing protein [Gammaproteobacteria bacterium]
MTVDEDRYELARQNRDPRFDGRFFVGVLTTGIYCRPVCPVRIPKRENVVLYPSAAAAAEAGFRPCLRCRPESSPGTPAWVGSSATVTRALQLISRGGTQWESTVALADSLGVGARQLTRLFRKHLGATPRSVLQTHRLHFAKRLLDETELPVSEICFAAGFGSIRRFNDVVKATYGTPPSHLRRHPAKLRQQPQGIHLKLAFRPPFDWAAMLDFFARRAIPGVESVTGSCYQRSFLLRGIPGVLQVAFTAGENCARLQIDYPDSGRLLEIVERVRQMFDLSADSSWIDQHLGRTPQLAAVVARYPGTRVPGCWDGLEIAVRAIVGQQVSVKAAITLLERLVARTGSDLPKVAERTGGTIVRVFPDAGQLAAADLSGLGITGQRIEAIRSIARAVAVQRLEFDERLNADEFNRRVRQIRGIGDWTAQYIALRSLRDPDAFPHGDLILRRALAAAGSKPMSSTDLLTIAESWRPWRAYAVMLLWRHYADAG